MPALETEVKFHLAERPAMRSRLLALGARSAGRRLERNLRLDDAQDSLARNQMLLRLRRDRRTTLTFKAPPAKPVPGLKQRIEIETAVGDFNAMRRILGRLGFRPRQVYEKRRETFVLPAAVFCLDELPFGDFLEIEAPPRDIARWAGRLALDWRRRILANYLEIFEQIRARHGLAFTDVTFRNFAGVSVDLASLLPQLEFGARSRARRRPGGTGRSPGRCRG
jgi:adenylate cyclase class 2